jgi:coenzyme F420-reducing hydrogenase delta subunit/heterodisulfide reductase subunit C
MTEANVSTAQSSAGPAPEDWKPHIVALVCNWCSYAGADMAGTTRLEYPSNVRMLRFPCTGRMSPLMILKAFEGDADGVLVSGCHPGDCHYVQGNLVARRRFTIFRSLMDFIGIDLKRLHFAWVSAAEGHKWAKVVGEVTAAVQEAGPLPGFEAPEGWDGIELPDMAGSGPQELDDKQLDAICDNLRKAATEILSTGRAGVVIAYGQGNLAGRTRPVFITDGADCDALVWGQGCRNNLSTYVASTLEGRERVAVVAKACDLGAISGLIREGQIRRDQVLVIGVQCPGVTDDSNLAAKCLACSGDPHPVCDLVVTVDGVQESCEDPSQATLDTPDARDEQIAYLESLPHGERWKYWQRQFARCLRCYACRAACPLCYCASCVAEKHRPQWVPTSIDNPGNSTWNIIRAIHLAGRCSGCDECARVCPADIRLDLINRKLALEVERHYGKVGLDPGEKSALVDFRMEDSEEFIL